MSIALTFAFAAATPFADLASIDAQVQQFTGAPIGAQGGAVQPVDRRLRLRSCRAPLAFSWRTQRRETVVVQCHDTGGWRLFVPVQAPRRAVAALPAINRGDAVSMAVSGSGFTVSRPAEAIESGKVGAWIKVRPVSSQFSGQRTGRQIIRAQVIRPGLVRLPLP